MCADAPAEIDMIWTKFAKDKNPELRGELITVYAPLVRFVVGRLGIPPTSLLEAEDLVSYGMIGLINAIDRFDPSRGVRFEAFASVRIRGAVIDQFARSTGSHVRLFHVCARSSLLWPHSNRDWDDQRKRRKLQRRWGCLRTAIDRSCWK